MIDSSGFLKLTFKQLDCLNLDPLEAICTFLRIEKPNTNLQILYNDCVRFASSGFVFNIAFVYCYYCTANAITERFLKYTIDDLNNQKFKTLEEAYNYLYAKAKYFKYFTIKVSSKYKDLTDDEKKELSEIIDNYISDHVRS